MLELAGDLREASRSRAGMGPAPLLWARRLHGLRHWFLGKSEWGRQPRALLLSGGSVSLRSRSILVGSFRCSDEPMGSDDCPALLCILAQPIRFDF
eukprot:6652171-Pyramimonas_sp.AAC.1